MAVVAASLNFANAAHAHGEPVFDVHVSSRNADFDAYGTDNWNSERCYGALSCTGAVFITNVTRPAAATLRRGPVVVLPSNSASQVMSLDGVTKARLTMEGGAMGHLRPAMFEGKQESFRQLAQLSQFWSPNGEIGIQKNPLGTVDRGDTVELDIVSTTSFAHAMHIHRKHFQDVLQGALLGLLRDTLLLFGGETRKIAFLASNPGDWLFHCHMLSHQDADMKTCMRVRG